MLAITHIVVFLKLAIIACIVKADKRECTEDFITYTYTECDKENGRWRVAVPRSDECVIKNPKPPIRGLDCGFSCSKGEYLDLDAQQCRGCPPGTYSLGSGVRFNTWVDIPTDFMLSVSSVSFAEYGYHSKVGNCSASLWKAQKDYISSNEDDCTSSISYSVNVKSEGSVSFTYQYTDEDVIFHFFIQNGECQTLHGSGKNVFLNTTATSWNTYKVRLDLGINILNWKTTGILLNGKRKVSPVLIKDIEVTGVSYTTVCHKCLEGHYSDSEGSHWCQICPENTFSVLGSEKCSPCDEFVEYAVAGSSECIKRPPCTEKDYFVTHAPCDSDNTTEVVYEWIEPKICDENNSLSVILPESGIRIECSPCNPGFTQKLTGCEPCADGTYSDGKHECAKCPASTAPMYGYYYMWWDTLPSTMDVSCLTVHSNECTGKVGWVPRGGMVQTSQGQVSNAYLVLLLRLDGFRSSKSKADGSREFGTIRFAFELFCKRNCVLYFMKEVPGMGTRVIDSWHGQRQKKIYSYVMTENSTLILTWAFQKSSDNSESTHKLVAEDRAEIYFVNVTNVINAPADGCHSCAVGANDNGCVPCPPGHFIHSEKKECLSCPYDYVLPYESIHDSDCVQCIGGTHSNAEHTACENDCTFNSSITGRKYDFSALSSSRAVSTPPSFTFTGRKYVHYFNFSFCGNGGFGFAECVDNVSSSMNMQFGDGSSQTVKGMVCRATKLQSVGRNGETVDVFSQPLVISSTIVEVYQEGKNGSNDMETDEGCADGSFFPYTDSDQELGDVIYVLSSDEEVAECTEGLKAYIHLRCDPHLTSEVRIEVPTKYPDGSCDGCNFHFLWRSVVACPQCTLDDYTAIQGQCENGMITTRFIWRSYPKNCTGGVPLPDYSKTPCLDLKLYVEIGVLAGVFMLTLLCIILCCLWKKSKKLEYKYQKLVNSGKGNELPAADSCAISDSESDQEGETNDEVVFQKKRARILAQNQTTNYESVSLKTLHPSV